MRAGKLYFIFIAFCCGLLFTPGVFYNYVEGSTATVEITARVSLIAYDIAAADVNSTAENITWMTNSLTNSTVEFGTTTDYGSLKNSSDMVMNHAIILEGLSAGTEYHYRVLSSDSAGAPCTSTDFTFTIPSGKGLIGYSGGVGGVSSFGNIVGMPALDLTMSSPELTIASGSPIPLTTDNLVAQPVVIVSSDGSATLSIDTSTRILDKDGQPVSRIGLTRIATKDVPTLPSGSLFVFSGYAYQIEPSGASFSPPLALKMTTTRVEWDQLSGQELSIQYYNPVSGLWEALSTTINPGTQTATTMLSHASDFGLFIRPASLVSSTETTISTTTVQGTKTIPREAMWYDRTIVIQLIALIMTIVAIGSIGLYLYQKWKGQKLK
jgi:hypothetical protein